MNREQYLLCKLAEECEELGKDAFKGAIFGMDDLWEDLPSSKDRILQEFSEIHAVMEMIFLPETAVKLDYKTIGNKIKKVEKYMEYSRERDRLNDTRREGD